MLWFSKVQMAPEAQKQHEAIRSEFEANDTLIDRKVDAVTGEVKAIGRDVRTVKCLLTTVGKRRQNCGLEP